MLKIFSIFAALTVNLINKTKSSLIMKKILLIVALMVMAATASFAQIGLRIGMDFASFRGDFKDDYKTNIGLHLGAVYNIELADVLSLQPGVFYVQRNWENKTTELKIRSHYIEVPVVLKYNLEVSSDIKIDPHVGPYFGFGFAGKSKEEIAGVSYRPFKKVGLNSKGDKYGLGIANFDMGIQMGVGASFYDAAYVGFDYEIGFNENGKAPYTGHNNMFMITFGVYLPD